MGMYILTGTAGTVYVESDHEWNAQAAYGQSVRDHWANGMGGLTVSCTELQAT